MSSRWGVDSEYGRLTDVLLCPPGQLPLAATSVDLPGARSSAGHRFDRRARSRASTPSWSRPTRRQGCTAHLLEPDPALPYQVFARDSSVMTPWGAFVTQPKQWWRRGEYAPVIRFYTGRDIPIWRMITAGALEGGDVMIVEPGCVVIGNGEERTGARGGPPARRLVPGRGLGGAGRADPGRLRPHRRSDRRAGAEARRRLRRAGLGRPRRAGCATRASRSSRCPATRRSSSASTRSRWATSGCSRPVPGARSLNDQMRAHGLELSATPTWRCSPWAAAAPTASARRSTARRCGAE